MVPILIQKWINLIRKMQANKPDEVTIISQPEENEGCIYAKIPVSYLKITQKKKKI